MRKAEKLVLTDLGDNKYFQAFQVSGATNLRLRFVKQHLSISQFSDVELCNFSVITGTNGAGKSHLLQAIENKSVRIVDRPEANVVLFNYENFRLRNEGRIAVFQMENERKQFWQNFGQESKGKSLKQQVSELIPKTLDEYYERLKKLAIELDKPLLSLSRAEVGSQEAYSRLVEYKKQLERQLDSDQRFRGDKEKASLMGLAKRVKVGIHELIESEFIAQLDMTPKDGIVPTQLSRVFSDYYSKLDANRYRAYRNERCGEGLEALTDEEFLERHGPKPWDVVNEVLERFGTLPYRINNPENLDRNDHFIAELQHQTRPDVRPQFDHLSSGERILMALVATVYHSTSDAAWPDVLLLDEVDASLHPSMIQNLLDVIGNTFLSRNMAVVLVSHSPTTVALAPEEAIHVMQAEGHNRIIKKSRKDALSILTEGFATLDEGLMLFDQVSHSDIVVLSEGRNVAYIKKFFELIQVNGVEVIDGIVDRSGKSQLKSAYDLFSKVPHKTHVVIVWDPDVTGFSSLNEENNTYPIVLAKNVENCIALKGIENLFPPELFAEFKTTVRDSRGNVTESFDSRRKVDFESFILKRGELSDFRHFKPLQEKILSLKEIAKNSAI